MPQLEFYYLCTNYDFIYLMSFCLRYDYHIYRRMLNDCVMHKNLREIYLLFMNEFFLMLDKSSGRRIWSGDFEYDNRGVVTAQRYTLIKSHNGWYTLWISLIINMFFWAKILVRLVLPAFRWNYWPKCSYNTFKTRSILRNRYDTMQGSTQQFMVRYKIALFHTEMSYLACGNCNYQTHSPWLIESILPISFTNFITLSM